MDDPLDAAFVTGLCYLLAPVGWQPVITTVLILLFTSRNTVQPFLAVFPRHVAPALEKAIEHSILEYTAWLLSCAVIMYSIHLYWEKLIMVVSIFIFSVCIISQWASSCWHQSHSKTNVLVRDVFVTVGDRHPDLLSLDHPLSKLVVNTKAELAKAHSLLSDFAAASVNVHGLCLFGGSIQIVPYFLRLVRAIQCFVMKRTSRKSRGCRPFLVRYGLIDDWQTCGKMKDELNLQDITSMPSFFIPAVRYT
ncbi:uncharacterized protein F5147DRAFT_821860 [Suillus discolor]|uniref:Uncharacterized protein n=1 Tax=Suillus discolor TaxID=1912936 RepID=A0A9P7FF05_9AGAM|nr:uncharacterized protein F5147DRAFT_821860 [Suillus discolor]KAG2114602.1 hypothetical protein F5147DRAFT_821860 [Suillus discolor]